MKLLTIFSIITFIIIDGVQNAPAVHPVPVYPVTGSSTQSSGGYSSDVIPITTPTSPSSSSSSSSSSSVTTPHSSSWYGQYTVVKMMLRIALYVLVFVLVCKILEKVCASKKRRQPNNEECPHVLNNKMYISTINGQREGPPPTYADIHKV